jgi:hypothetical protein
VTNTRGDGRTFCNTLPGKVEHDNACSLQSRREEGTVDLGVRTIADGTRKEEICELREYKKDTGQHIIH